VITAQDSLPTLYHTHWHFAAPAVAYFAKNKGLWYFTAICLFDKREILSESRDILT